MTIAESITCPMFSVLLGELMQNKINVTAQENIGDYTVKLAEVGSGHHVISYKVITDKDGEHHEATLLNNFEDAHACYLRRVQDAKMQGDGDV